LDYIGNSNFPYITSREYILKTFGGEKMIRKFVDAWIGYKNRYRITVKDLASLK